MINEPEDTQEDATTEKTFKDSVKESTEWVVDMMNSGKPNPEDVYPRGRYQGD